MSERDRFDLTRGGEAEQGSAAVSSLRGRRRPDPPPGPRAQLRPHREFAARVRVPLSAGLPPPPVATDDRAVVDWNEQDTAIRRTHRVRETMHRKVRAVGFGVALITALAIALLAQGMIVGGRPSHRQTNTAALIGRPVERLVAGISSAAAAHHVAIPDATIERKIASDRLTDAARGRARKRRPHLAAPRRTRSAARRHSSPATTSAGDPEATDSQGAPTQASGVIDSAPAAAAASPTTSSGARSGSASTTGSGSGSGAKKGPPPCYLGTLGCQ
jgi:hypothetical protein